MARVRTMADLILDCRQRAEMENSEFCTDAEIEELLNQELAELYNHIWTAADKPHYRGQTTYTVTGNGDALQALPIDFLSVQEVMCTFDGYTYSMQTFMASEHAAYQNQDWSAWVGTPRYRIQAGNIEFVPPRQAFSVTLYYTPCLSRLVNPSDTFDGVNGWEVAAIYGTVAQMLQKEQSDPSFYEGRKLRILKDVDSWASKRDAMNPERVQEVIAYDPLGLGNIGGVGVPR